MNDRRKSPDAEARDPGADAARSSRVKVWYEAPAQPRNPIVYCAAAVKGRPKAVLAGRFLDLLGSGQARAVLAEHGFVTEPSLAFPPDSGQTEERKEAEPPLPGRAMQKETHPGPPGHPSEEGTKAEE